jgi:hypothetical protein
MLPNPFTMAIAADLLAGGRGTALDTQTAVNANPVADKYVTRSSTRELTCVSKGHQKH